MRLCTSLEGEGVHRAKARLTRALVTETTEGALDSIGQLAYRFRSNQLAGIRLGQYFGDGAHSRRDHDAVRGQSFEQHVGETFCSRRKHDNVEVRIQRRDRMHSAEKMHPLGQLQIVSKTFELTTLGTIARDEKGRSSPTIVECPNGAEQNVNALFGAQSADDAKNRTRRLGKRQLFRRTVTDRRGQNGVMYEPYAIPEMTKAVELRLRHHDDAIGPRDELPIEPIVDADLSVLVSHAVKERDPRPPTPQHSKRRDECRRLVAVGLNDVRIEPIDQCSEAREETDVGRSRFREHFARDARIREVPRKRRCAASAPLKRHHGEVDACGLQRASNLGQLATRT